VDAKDAGVLAPELQEFIDRLIVPLLVEELMKQEGPLYRAESSQYDDEGLAHAA
jgi:hypothetical protein